MSQSLPFSLQLVPFRNDGWANFAIEALPEGRNRHSARISYCRLSPPWPSPWREGRAGWSCRSDAAAEKDWWEGKLWIRVVRRGRARRRRHQASFPGHNPGEKRPLRIALPYSSSVIRSTGPVALHPRLTTGSPLLQGLNRPAMPMITAGQARDKRNRTPKARKGGPPFHRRGVDQ